MRAVLLTGVGLALTDGVVVGVALGVGRTALGLGALAVGVLAAVVLGWVAPDARPVDDGLVTLGTRPTPEPAATEPETEAPVGVGADPVRTPVPAAASRRSLPTPAAA